MPFTPPLTTFLAPLREVALASLWIVDAKLRLTFVEGDYLRELAGGVPVAIGADIQTVLPSDDMVDRVLAGHVAALGGAPVSFEHEWAGRVFRVRVEPDRGPSGEVRGCVGVSVDISDQRESQRQLLRVQDEFERRAREGALEEARAREAQRLFAATVEQSADAVAITTPSWAGGAPVIFYVNPAFTRTTGLSAAEAVGAPISILEEGGSSSDAWTKLRKSVVDGAACELELLLRRRNGEPYPALWKCTPIRGADDSITHFVMSHRDVTFEKKKEAALRASEEQLRQSQKMEAVGRLAGGIAHDFNNLLAVILAYTTLIRDALDEADPIRSDLEEVRRAGERAGTLTRQLLSFSSKQVIQPMHVDVNVAIADVVRMLRRLIGEHIVVETEFQPGLPFARLGRGQIEQIVVNLAVNARDAMPTGGTLTITTSLLDTVPSNLRPADGPEGAAILLTVCDSGLGMSSETMLHIFEPFYTTKEPGKGTGLGLSTVYGIVQQNNGTITVESEAGKGSLFRIVLPVNPGTRDTMQPGPDEGAALGGSETVLVVEDDEMVRRLVGDVLHRAGYEVLLAASPTEARAAAMVRPEGIALLLADMVLPEMSGRDLASLLLPMHRGMKVAFMSGYADEATLQGVADGDAPFLAKPFSSESLLQVVRRAIDGVATK